MLTHSLLLKSKASKCASWGWQSAVLSFYFTNQLTSGHSKGENPETLEEVLFLKSFLHLGQSLPSCSIGAVETRRQYGIILGRMVHIHSLTRLVHLRGQIHNSQWFLKWPELNSLLNTVWKWTLTAYLLETCSCDSESWENFLIYFIKSYHASLFKNLSIWE